MPLPGLIQRQIETIECIRGTAGSFTITFKDKNGTALNLTGVITADSSTNLEAKVWNPPGNTVLCSPSLVGATPSSGTATLLITADDILALPVNRYPVEARVTLNSRKYPGWRGELIVLEGPTS